MINLLSVRSSFSEAWMCGKYVMRRYHIEHEGTIHPPNINKVPFHGRLALLQGITSTDDDG